MAKKKLPRGVVQFEGAPLQKGKSTRGPGKGPGTNQDLNPPIARRDPAGVVRSGGNPRGKVAYEAPSGRRGK